MNEELELDPLFVGATRPAMIWGVTHEFAVIGGMLVSIFFLNTGNPLNLFIYVPIHILGYLICLKDPRKINVILGSLKCYSKCQNRFFWGWKSTYTPR